jgi:hypothetical protein
MLDFYLVTGIYESTVVLLLYIFWFLRLRALDAGYSYTLTTD